MIAWVDVDYREAGAVAACLVAADWRDPEPRLEFVEPVHAVEPYETGHFYRRELPCLAAVLQRVPVPIDVVVIDGYVWLGDGTVPGLGAHLFNARGQRGAVVGIAKTAFLSARTAREVFRGTSRRPLYVTAAGIDPELAAGHVEAMHGPFRIPTLVRRVDQLCRRGVAGA